MSRNPTWLQHFYHHPRLKSETLLESLWDQMRELREVQSAMTAADPAVLAEAVAALDIELLRYACAALRARLEEAAQRDCAQLIADSVLDVVGPERAAEQWVKWLAVAPCWPQLARTQWHHAVASAAARVLEAIESGGVDLTPKATEEIEEAVTALQLQDLLSTEAYAQFYPAAPAEAEAP